MTRTARFTAAQAKNIGSCAVIAISEVTGLSWDQVWEVAQYYFKRTGLNSCDKSAILKELGYRMDGFWKLHNGDLSKPMTVTQAEAWLQTNMPDANLICSINVGGSFHAVSFRKGRFHNLQGAKRSRIKLAYAISRA